MSYETCPSCGAAITGAVCARCRRAVRLDLAKHDLAGAALAGADLRNVDLTGANLAGADLSNSDLRGAKLDGVDVRGANLEGARIDVVYAQFLTRFRLKGYTGTPAWGDPPPALPPEGARWAVKEHPVRCPCCGGDKFVLTRTALDPHSWAPDSLTVLTCVACSRIEWFRAEPTLRL
jgi:hypothetical protein